MSSPTDTLAQAEIQNEIAKQRLESILATERIDQFTLNWATFLAMVCAPKLKPPPD